MYGTRLKHVAGWAAAAVMPMTPAPGFAAVLAPQTSSDQGITVQVKPVDVSASAGTRSFEVAFNTHTQALPDDPMRTATLTGGGAAQSPTAWDGDPTGGHHRKGVLRFAPIVPVSDTLELRIQRPSEGAPIPEEIGYESDRTG